MTYAEKLGSPKWQKVRLQVFEREDFHCELCKTNTVQLHVHHKTYKKHTEVHDYPLDNFVAICRDCHYIVEFFKDRNNVLNVGRMEKGDMALLAATIKDEKKQKGIAVFSKLALSKKKPELMFVVAEDAFEFLKDQISLPINERLKDHNIDDTAMHTDLPDIGNNDTWQKTQHFYSTPTTGWEEQ